MTDPFLRRSVLLLVMIAGAARAESESGVSGRLVAEPAETTGSFLKRAAFTTLGAALPLTAAVPATFTTSCGGAFFCPTVWPFVTYSPAPTVIGHTAWLGHYAAGGKGSPFWSLIGAGAGSAVSMALLFGMSALPDSQVYGRVGLGISALLAPVFVTWLALELAHQRAVSAGATEVILNPPASRTLLSFLTSFAVLGASTLAFALGAAGLNGSPVLGVGAMTLSGAAVFALQPLAVWAVHRKLGGRGGLGWAYLGNAIGLVASATGAVITGMAYGPSNSQFKFAGAMAGIGIAILVAPLGTIVALEVSHANTAAPDVTGPAPKKRNQPFELKDPSVMFTPIQGGGLLSAAFTF